MLSQVGCYRPHPSSLPAPSSSKSLCKTKSQLSAQGTERDLMETKRNSGVIAGVGLPHFASIQGKFGEILSHVQIFIKNEKQFPKYWDFF